MIYLPFNISKIRCLAYALAVSFPLVAAAADGINKRDLKSTPDAVPIKILELAVAHRVESIFSTTNSYKLPPGAYHPLGQDSEGIYYACSSGIVVVTTLKDGTQFFNHLVGGVYLANEEKSAPKVWFVGAGAAATRGANKLTQDEAGVITEGCDDSRPYLGTEGGNVVNITVLPTDLKSIGSAAVGGAIGTVLVNAIIGANDGRLLTPAVRFEKPLLMEKPN